MGTLNRLSAAAVLLAAMGPAACMKLGSGEIVGDMPDAASAAAPDAQSVDDEPDASPVTAERQRPRPPLPAVSANEIGIGDTSRPWIALTFDAGAGSGPATQILDTLYERDLYCTFFLTGDWMRTNPNLLARIVEDDHEIANHSEYHPDFTTLTDADMRRELDATEQAASVESVTTKPFFRPPFGARNQHVRELLADEGYLTVMWTYHVWDWVEDATADSVYQYAVDGAENGAIAVLHVGAQQTADALPRIIDELQERGFRLVTLAEVLAPPGWEP